MNAVSTSIDGISGDLSTTKPACRTRLPWTGPARERQELLFRPEDVRIVDGHGAHLRGTVVAAFFLGDHTRLIVDTGAPQPIVRDYGNE
jgi:ABC-type Fe3+/spermidine/putrescine transport system ATPase subunit